MIFISTAITFWTSDYLLDVRKVDPTLVLIIFIVTCVTAPTLGIIFGGIFVQRFGGYTSKYSMFICFGFALGSSIVSIPVHFAGFTIFAICLWLVLFFGGALIPNLMGNI